MILSQNISNNYLKLFFSRIHGRKVLHLASFLYFFLFLSIKDYAQVNSDSRTTKVDTVKIENYIYQDTSEVQTPPTQQNTNDSIVKENQKSSQKKALDAPFEYVSSDSTEILLSDQKIRLYKDAEVHYQSIELKAENIVLDMSSKIIVAYGITDSLGNVRGKPHFKDGAEEFEADTIVYNFDTKKGLIKGVFSKQDEGYLHSQINKKLANNEICIKNGKYTTCDLAHPHFYLALTKAKVIPDDKIVSGPAYLVIEDVIVPVGIPFGFFPNRKGGASGVIIPGYGDDLNRGFYLRDGGYYLYINDYLDTKILADVYSNGSWGLANETRYNARYRFKGNLYGKYSKFISNADEPTRSEETSYNIRWRHQQDAKANPYSSLSANVNFGSSNFKKYNNTSENNRLSTTQNSSISYNRKFANSPFNLSINARQSQNTNIAGGAQVGKMNITLPEANLSMNRIYPFKGLKKVGPDTWYEKIGITYNANFKNSVTNLDEDTLWSHYTLTQFKNGMQHRIPISTNFKIMKFINVTPSFNITERWYFKSLHRTYNMDSARIDIDTLDGFARAGDFMVSIPFTTKLYGMYQIKGKDPLIRAFRHIATPTVSFSWRPDFSDKKWGYYEHIYAGDSLIGRFSRFEGTNGSWSGVYGSPPKGKSGMINFNLNNNLEMKVRNRNDTVKGTKVVKLLDRLSFRTGYNLALDSMNWSDLSISAGTQIAKILNIDMTVNFNPYDYDRTTGRDINKLLWAEGNIGRLDKANLSAGIRLTSKGLKNERKKSNLSEGDKETLRNYGISEQMIDMGYADFSMPWSLNVRYSINYSQIFSSAEHAFNDNVTQTFNFDGSVNITKNWKGVFRSGWDVQKHEVSYTSITLLRDLHCWQMSFNWVPFGAYQSYYFKINVKSAMLQDLKYEQRRSWLEDL